MQDLVLFHAALADENRLRLLSLIRGGEICVCQLQGVLQTNQPKISRHLAYLRKAGLVAARQDGKWTHYRLEKLEAGLAKILCQVLDGLQNLPQIKSDRQRLKSIGCDPAPFGVSRPRGLRRRLLPARAS
jgi:ArsR family transcriptional regulator